MAVAMLSLVSNPFDPFREFELWSAFDRTEGFDTAGFLARCVSLSSELPDEVNEDTIEQAIDDILNNPSFSGLYKKVFRDAA
jgi:hypothetical protein